MQWYQSEGSASACELGLTPHQLDVLWWFASSDYQPLEINLQLRRYRLTLFIAECKLPESCSFLFLFLSLTTWPGLAFDWRQAQGTGYFGSQVRIQRRFLQSVCARIIWHGGYGRRSDGVCDLGLLHSDAICCSTDILWHTMTMTMMSLWVWKTWSVSDCALKLLASSFVRLWACMDVWNPFFSCDLDQPVWRSQTWSVLLPLPEPWPLFGSSWTWGTLGLSFTWKGKVYLRKSVPEFYNSCQQSPEPPISFRAQHEAYIVSAATTSTGSNMPSTNAGLGTFARIPLSIACRQHLSNSCHTLFGKARAWLLVLSPDVLPFHSGFRGSDSSIFVSCVALLDRWRCRKMFAHFFQRSLFIGGSLAAQERALRTAGLSDNWLEEWVRGKDLKTS